MRYDLHWKCLPMDAIQSHDDWYEPFLGSGLYMLVAATTRGGYVGYYVGKSDDIGRRWRQHLKSWFLEPHEGYWIPESAEEFLEDPVAAFNCERLKQGLKCRQDIQAHILKSTWFCFAEVDALRPWHTLENVEYVLQEGLKKHAEICKKGYIGDTGRGRPGGELVIDNHFGRAFLGGTLPGTIRFSGATSVEVG
ncbi:MAG: GIY-YIG nuclease family protein [Gammaproteobacteria bacterium]|nr:GIY-YIG nuclease family protein [Gammaproteobacteria bacterium]